MVFNKLMVCSWVRRHNPAATISIIGGLLGAVACEASPSLLVKQLWWVPTMLDILASAIPADPDVGGYPTNHERRRSFLVSGKARDLYCRKTLKDNNLLSLLASTWHRVVGNVLKQ
jgi:hypothetical protein